MDWQAVAVWLVVGCVVIWIAGRIFKRYLFRKDGRDDKNPPRRG